MTGLLCRCVMNSALYLEKSECGSKRVWMAKEVAIGLLFMAQF